MSDRNLENNYLKSIQKGSVVTMANNKNVKNTQNTSTNQTTTPETPQAENKVVEEKVEEAVAVDVEKTDAVTTTPETPQAENKVVEEKEVVETKTEEKKETPKAEPNKTVVKPEVKKEHAPNLAEIAIGATVKIKESCKNEGKDYKDYYYELPFVVTKILPDCLILMYKDVTVAAPVTDLVLA